jgi:DNA topoisomerase VI subunit B
MQRKVESESESRRNVETNLARAQKRLDEELSKRGREAAASERAISLDKQVTELQDKLKSETEAGVRLRKQVAELAAAR